MAPLNLPRGPRKPHPVLTEFPRILLELTRDLDHANKQIGHLHGWDSAYVYTHQEDTKAYFSDNADKYASGRVIPFSSRLNNRRFSNMLVDCPFIYMGDHYDHSEQAYQATSADRAGLYRTAETARRNNDPPSFVKQEVASMIARFKPGFKESRKWHGSFTSRLYMRSILMCKFQQNPALLADLLSTGHAFLAEALPDFRWGCGMDHAEMDIWLSNGAKPKDFPGENWCGNLLMEVREYFRHLIRAIKGESPDQVIPFALDRHGQPTRHRVHPTYTEPEFVFTPPLQVPERVCPQVPHPNHGEHGDSTDDESQEGGLREEDLAVESIPLPAAPAPSQSGETPPTNVTEHLRQFWAYVRKYGAAAAYRQLPDSARFARELNEATRLNGKRTASEMLGQPMVPEPPLLTPLAPSVPEESPPPPPSRVTLRAERTAETYNVAKTTAAHLPSLMSLQLPECEYGGLPTPEPSPPAPLQSLFPGVTAQPSDSTVDTEPAFTIRPPIFSTESYMGPRVYHRRPAVRERFDRADERAPRDIAAVEEPPLEKRIRRQERTLKAVARSPERREEIVQKAMQRPESLPSDPEPEPESHMRLLPILPDACPECSLVHDGPCLHVQLRPELQPDGYRHIFVQDRRHYIARPNLPGPVRYLPGGLNGLRCYDPESDKWTESLAEGQWVPHDPLTDKRYWMETRRRVPGKPFFQAEIGPPNAHVVDAAKIDAVLALAELPDTPGIYTPVPPAYKPHVSGKNETRAEFEVRVDTLTHNAECGRATLRSLDYSKWETPYLHPKYHGGQRKH